MCFLQLIYHSVHDKKDWHYTRPDVSLHTQVQSVASCKRDERPEWSFNNTL